LTSPVFRIGENVRSVAAGDPIAAAHAARAGGTAL
jgi:hypothetical protein